MAQSENLAAVDTMEEEERITAVNGRFTVGFGAVVIGGSVIARELLHRSERKGLEEKMQAAVEKGLTDTQKTTRSEMQQLDQRESASKTFDAITVPVAVGIMVMILALTRKPKRGEL